MHDWDEYQYKSDVSTERVKLFRKRFRQRFTEQDETVSVTPPDTDTDTDTDKSTSKRKNSGLILTELERVLEPERAKAVIEHRTKLRKPLTAHAAKLLASKFSKLPNPNDGADAMIANGWQGFEPDWLLNRNGPRFNGPAQKRTLMDAARDWIAEGDDGKNSQDGARGHDKLISAKDAKS